jgi:putative flavoprotein involved in K+ transport
VNQATVAPGVADLAPAVDAWLARFERALGARDDAALRALFHPDSYWRDLLALTWRIRTVSGREAILAALAAHAARARPTGFGIDPRRTAPRRVTRAGTGSIEALFRFETAEGRGSGVVHLLPGAGDGDAPKAWTLLTALDALRGFEERVGVHRPKGESYSRDFRGPNWLDLRRAAAGYTDRDPAVLVVGGGQAGLSIAARLAQLDVDTLIVDRWPRIGDNWRQRYHALTLHNQVQVNHLPYMPFPPNWPTYIPKDKLAGWFEAYVEAMELNYWTGTELVGGEYDERAGRWTIALRRVDGTSREMRPRHVVMATGVSGIPSLPDIPTLREFRGEVLHSHGYTDGEAWRGKRALVIGTGNSGHDIAQDLHSSGAQVVLVQRGSTLIVNIEPSAQLAYTLYDEGLPLEDCDLIASSMPFALVRRSHIALTEQGRQLDRPLLESLERVGFKLDFGEDGSGWQFKYLTRGGGYYFNVGCSELVASGAIRLVQFDDIAGFVAEGARLRSGETLPADLVVLATGYKGLEDLVRKLFGEAVAARVGPVWGFDAEQELRNMFARTPQPGLWFIAGSLAQCRIYSKYLALQIKASEAGLSVPPGGAAAGSRAKDKEAR